MKRSFGVTKLELGHERNRAGLQTAKWQVYGRVAD